jgi:hypothetical protein
VNVGGDIMSIDGTYSSSSADEQLPVLHPDQEAEIANQLLAPEQPGMYTTYCRAQTNRMICFSLKGVNKYQTR